MPCYCNKVRELTNKVADLRQSLNHISDTEGACVRAEKPMRTASSDFEAGFSHVKKEKVTANGIYGACNCFVCAVRGARSAVEGELASANSSLTFLTNEDNAHHERLRQAALANAKNNTTSSSSSSAGSTSSAASGGGNSRLMM